MDPHRCRGLLSVLGTAAKAQTEGGTPLSELKEAINLLLDFVRESVESPVKEKDPGSDQVVER